MILLSISEKKSFFILQIESSAVCTYSCLNCIKQTALFGPVLLTLVQINNLIMLLASSRKRDHTSESISDSPIYPNFLADLKCFLWFNHFVAF